MSIFASMASPDDDEHTEECARWDKKQYDDGGWIWEISDRPCDCGQPDAPMVYHGSHVLPSENDPRGGYVDIALIPPHVRFWRENPDAPVHEEPDIGTHAPEPYLRFGVNNETVILTERNVRMIHETLSEWLELRSVESEADRES